MEKFSKWKLEYWAPSKGALEKWFDSLNKDQISSLAKELKLLEIAGNGLRLPHSKSLGKGLFELRERKFGYRVYYTFIHTQIIILLAAGDKKSQTRDIKIARQRLIDLMN